jgi:hypothetical protein
MSRDRALTDIDLLGIVERIRQVEGVRRAAIDALIEAEGRRRSLFDELVREAGERRAALLFAMAEETATDGRGASSASLPSTGAAPREPIQQPPADVDANLYEDHVFGDPEDVGMDHHEDEFFGVDVPPDRRSEAIRIVEHAQAIVGNGVDPARANPFSDDRGKNAWRSRLFLAAVAAVART